MHFGRTAVILFQKSHHHISQITARFNIQAPDNTKVYQHDITIFGNKYIARMHITMEITINEYGMEK
jgi:hypothetical protein